uniref:Uncharacterized protein n=1 Tax=Caenorhabditis japonica TaxID=281687 RepID=A0A8R1IFR4_CAEJA
MTSGMFEKLSKDAMKQLVKKMLDEDSLSTSMDFVFYRRCNPSNSSYSVQICGKINTSRKFGMVKRIAPIGKFVNGGLLYRYYDMSHTAVFPHLTNCNFTTATTPDGDVRGDDRKRIYAAQRSLYNCRQIGTSTWGRPMCKGATT